MKIYRKEDIKLHKEKQKRSENAVLFVEWLQVPKFNKIFYKPRK